MDRGDHDRKPRRPPRRGRRGAAAAYDLANGVSVLFGGATPGNSSQTWLYDGSNWVLATPASSPPARREAAMAYDIARSRCILFGGRGNSGELNDTWEWDGTNWNQMSPATTPSIRQGHSMAYDAARGVTILFGGSRNPDFCFPVLTDTWEWDGVDWTPVTTSNAPSSTVYGGMVYDLARQTTVYYGGTDCGVTDTGTYEYDGTNWTDVSATVGSGPSYFPGIALARHGMVYDTASAVTVLYGGRNEGVGGYSNGTWKYDGAAWTEVASGTPSTRTGYSMVYDELRSTAVLYGGTNVAGLTVWFQETWEYACPAASFERTGQGCGVVGGPPPLINSFDLPTIGSTFTLDYTGPNGVTPVGDDHPFFLIGFTPLSLPVPPITPSQPAGCTLYVDPVVTVDMPLIGSTYQSQLDLTMPTGLDLLGLPFYAQVATVYTHFGSGTTFVRFTNRADMVVGL